MSRIFTNLEPKTKEEFQNTPAIKANNLYEDCQVAFVFADGQLIEVIFE